MKTQNMKKPNTWASHTAMAGNLHDLRCWHGYYHLLPLVSIEIAQSDTFKAPCCCFQNAPNTALTIVCNQFEYWLQLV